MAALRSIDKQREQFLDGCKIGGREKIAGIGPSRISTLASFGIETAWDIQPHKVLAIPGFGPSMVTKLVAWRQSKEARFRFNPNHPVAAVEINAIEADLRVRSNNALATLQSAPSLLRSATEGATRVLAETEPAMNDLWITWKLAERHKRDASLFWG